MLDSNISHLEEIIFLRIIKVREVILNMVIMANKEITVTIEQNKNSRQLSCVNITLHLVTPKLIPQTQTMLNKIRSTCRILNKRISKL